MVTTVTSVTSIAVDDESEQYRPRWMGPQQVAQIDLRPSVERA